MVKVLEIRYWGKKMSNLELREKYPIGTRIKYILNSCYASECAKEDIGKVGKIVGFTCYNYPIIFLSGSTHVSQFSTKQRPASWSAGWCSVEVLPQKNQQLLFAFMED